MELAEFWRLIKNLLSSRSGVPAPPEESQVIGKVFGSSSPSDSAEPAESAPRDDILQATSLPAKATPGGTTTSDERVRLDEHGRESNEFMAKGRIAAWKANLYAPAHAWQIKAGDKTLQGTGRVLELDGLGLETLPETLRTIESPFSLILRDNRLRELPRWIGDLSGLTLLDVSGNQLQTFPDEIGALQKLEILVAAENELSSLPEALGQLELKSLFLRNNPDLGLPESLLETAAPSQILRYYFDSRADLGQPLLELKLLIVGRGRAGKTTLIKALAGEKRDAGESETHSIAIRDLTLTCSKGMVRSHAWDFGGQEILHSTHQFFLTERSLYLLVLEPRTGLAQRDAEYWLKLIETQGKSSPVIVVMNWSRGRPWQVDKVKLRRKFPFVVDFVSTDAYYGDGVEDLRSLILHTVNEKMPDVWLPFPKKWREIKDSVAGMQQNFLTYHQYRSLCMEFKEQDSAAQSDLASILHALGLALYFGKDPRLHDTRVLRPGWVTGGVYAVIRSALVKKNDGQFSSDEMALVLREAEAANIAKMRDYPIETQPFILELMRAFQLCYASAEEKGKPTRYLVPELLPEFEPEMHQLWEKAPLRLRYRYEVFPPGLLPRFIVRTHALSDGAPHWRYGVVLRHADVEALIRAESDRPELQLFILGGDDETRRVLVTMVRRQLESLHVEMKMQPVEELELTGENEQWISVKALREVEQPGQPTQRLPVQPEGTANVDVALELDKLSPTDARAIERDPTRAPDPVRIFVCYAHDDERQLRRLDMILDVLEQQCGLASWRDKRLIAGEEWNEEIRRRLEEMDILLFVASQTSLVRPYIKDPELRRALERREAGQVEIACIKT